MDPISDGSARPSGGDSSRHATVLDVLGHEIVSGVLQRDSILRIEALQERFGVSRTVIREVLRSLQALNMVRARSKVGTRVNGAAEWTLLNPVVIGWRAATDYRQQMVELLQLRRGIEGTAARLCAEHMTDGQRAALAALGDTLVAAAAASDGPSFLAADTEFHGLLLEGSGNQVMGQFAAIVRAALHSRASAAEPLITASTSATAALHKEVGLAILSGDASAAERLTTEIADQTLAEFD